MKRFLKPICSLLLVLTLCSCADGAGRSINPEYPKLEYANSTWRFDPYNREIKLVDGFYLDEGHSYDIVETDAGYDLVLHFIASEVE